ncbi:MAG: zinc transporter, family [Patescibacteria group bacterium]|jgi:ZIP family zinc transporter|nr:zinc transporter, family [Patescibacteria group bacterium]
MDAFWFALSLTFLAGIATMIGAVFATLKRFTSRSAMAISLGFSAGAILYVSLTDILNKSEDSFAELYSDPRLSYGMMALAFFLGVGLMVIADRLIPSEINLDDQEGTSDSNADLKRKLMRGGLFIGLALCLHNFPEGFLVFMTAYDDPSVGIAIAVALAIHNIPEGIAIAGPLYAATKQRYRSIAIATATGIAEPVGAVMGFLLLREFLNETLFGWVFGVVAGMMVFICVNEILPAAHRFETKQRQTTYGFIAGMAVLAGSISMLQ